MQSTSNKPILSLFKSGWVYLWCILIIAVVSLDQQGYWQGFDRLNRSLWSSEPLFSPANQRDDHLYSIIDINFDQEAAAKIQNLANSYPNATFALTGHFSDAFLQDLRSPAYQSLLEKSILLDSQGKTAVVAISSKMTNALSPILAFAVNQAETKKWQVSKHPLFALQPQLSRAKKDHFALVWRDQKEFYPSFLGLALAKYFTSNARTSDLRLELGIQNQFLINNKVFLIGVQGEVIGLDQPPKSWTREALIEFAKQNPEQAKLKTLIFIDDLSIPAAKPLAKTLASLINSHYLTSNWLSKSVEYLLLLVALLSFVSLRRLSSRYKVFLIISAVGFLLLLQSFFMSHLDWMSIRLLVMVSLVTLVIRWAFIIERKQVEQQASNTNQLLSDSAVLFLQNQKLDRLMTYLDSVQPDNQLINAIFQTAIEAEAQQNLEACKQLHQWIVSKDPNFRPSIDRLATLFPNQNPLSNDPDSDSADTLKVDNFDQTLAVSPKVQGQNLPSNSLVNIKHFGRYQVEGILGRGAMGIVFQGVDPKINRQVAIKTLMINEQLDGEPLEVAKKRFFREAETAGKLSHANIVTIYDVGEQHQAESGQTLGYIAMDLLTGAPLSEFTKKDKLLPTPLVYQLMIQMTDALEYAHKQKVVHRDIKPANILFDDELQRGTLTDFGIAYMADHSKTKTGTIMGSPYYMSPEQIIGVKVDGRSDIFSLGVTFYQLLSGQLPFTGESIATVAFQITKSKHQSVRQWNKKLPSSAARITNKALQKDKNKRYQSMAEFREALTKALARDFKKAPLS